MNPPERARPGRVVVLTTSYPAHPDDPSGHFVAAEVRALRAAGHAVCVLAPRASDASSPDEPSAVPLRSSIARDSRAIETSFEEVRFLPAGTAFGWPGALQRLRDNPLRIFGVLRFLLAARRELARLGDVERVFAHFVLPSAWPLAARFARTRKLTVVAHGSDVRLLARLPAWLRRHIARSLEGAAIRCVSEQLCDQLARALGSPLSAPLSVEPAALDLAGVPSRALSRARLGVSTERWLLVIVGRLVPSKRVELALLAARAVSDALVVVVGDGPERAKLERAFPEARFVGHTPRSVALTWIAAADVLLSASREEGAPSVVREARALGTYVVATAAGDLERWSQRDPGLLVVGAGGAGA